MHGGIYIKVCSIFLADTENDTITLSFSFIAGRDRALTNIKDNFPLNTVFTSHDLGKKVSNTAAMCDLHMIDIEPQDKTEMEESIRVELKKIQPGHNYKVTNIV